jgi:NTE family protein
LVLGGGGVAGAAWETGIVLGLLDAGVDLRLADRFVGTSAGSRVAAELTNRVPLAESFARLVALPPAYEIPAEFDSDALMTAFGNALNDAKPGPAFNVAIGRYALAAETVAEPVRREIIAGRLTVHSWPAADLRIVAIDTETGEQRVFTRADAVDLVDAVAASCAVPGVWPPVTIDGVRYIDGGMRSSSNPDLAAGCDQVVIIAPMPELPLSAPGVKKAIKALHRSAKVVSIGPDEASTAAIGTNPLDPATARPAAEAGRAQAASHVDEVAAVWSVGG